MLALLRGRARPEVGENSVDLEDEHVNDRAADAILAVEASQALAETTRIGEERFVRPNRTRDAAADITEESGAAVGEIGDNLDAAARDVVDHERRADT